MSLFLILQTILYGIKKDTVIREICLMPSVDTRKPKAICQVASLMNTRFGRARIDLQLDEYISAHNLAVHKNREILRRFIDVVCYLGKQELSIRVRVQLEESANRGNLWNW